MKIAKLKSTNSNGFIPGTWYCFNYHLEGPLCQHCISKDECKEEKSMIENFVNKEGITNDQS